MFRGILARGLQAQGRGPRKTLYGPRGIFMGLILPLMGWFQTADPSSVSQTPGVFGPRTTLAQGHAFRAGTGGVFFSGNFAVGGFGGRFGLGLGTLGFASGGALVGGGFGNGFVNRFGFAGGGLPYGGLGLVGGLPMPGLPLGLSGLGLGGLGGGLALQPWAFTYGYGYPFGVGRYGTAPLFAGYRGPPLVIVAPWSYGLGGYGIGLAGLAHPLGGDLYGPRFGLGGRLVPSEAPGPADQPATNTTATLVDPAGLITRPLRPGPVSPVASMPTLPITWLVPPSQTALGSTPPAQTPSVRNRPPTLGGRGHLGNRPPTGTLNPGGY